MSTVGFEEEQIRASIKHQEQFDAQGSDEPGEFSPRHNKPWQPLGLLTTVKPPALRGRYDWPVLPSKNRVVQPNPLQWGAAPHKGRDARRLEGLLGRRATAVEGARPADSVAGER